MTRDQIMTEVETLMAHITVSRQTIPEEKFSDILWRINQLGIQLGEDNVTTLLHTMVENLGEKKEMSL